ncbi:ImmA/IrrE family metallo-endopeptidase [Microbispora sp. NBC_01389]|uniref:ImmA/IrrE family metallo-endopeptidase n=1 Tax=Microbispora sp. NBC_01389 TaxID=2903584 RepID=UPI003256807E
MTKASELNVTWEWEQAPGVMARELKETWARIEISVGDDWVTLVQDHASGASRRSIYAPLYPLAEWIAYNWWFLKADSRPASYCNISRARRPKEHPDVLRRFHQRHGMRSSGDGFLWPDLLIIPEGRETRLVWSRDRTSSREHPTRFISQGEAQIEATLVSDRLGLIVTGVIARLEERGVRGTPLATEWQSIQAADEEEAEFCLAAARLGLDPYSDARKFEPEILRVAQELGGQVYVDFLNAVDPGLIGRTLNWVKQARDKVNELPAQASESAALSLREAIRGAGLRHHTLPWRQGWSQAREVRQALELEPDEVFDPTELVSSVLDITADPGIQAAGNVPTQKRPLVVVGHSYPATAERFTLSRALWHVIYEDDPFFLVTAAYTDRHKIERAFAAELLAPAEGIAEELGNLRMISAEELERIAEHFRVSTFVVQHQVENQLGVA